ncbi:uncharacterized protein LOC123318359 [Coccinella septempunctata]|uniref:uncharacterized protein LOC123318359 n=1 Tax=Coccinella septempunctata TaxID=41139 RepID=UPI001D072E43|nr:uncharacterized protein LOC123318359 [Coccinella septempunctata]
MSKHTFKVIIYSDYSIIVTILKIFVVFFRYIRNIDGSFGFQREVFEMLKEKTKHMEVWERHGCLLVDECKVSKTKKFDKNLMEFVGFIDLVHHTPQKMENSLGDHALVIMFQPFAGHGLALACFLSGGDISGEILSKIMLECIILCENAGLYIDVNTSDGAIWNRKMWT